MDRRAKKLEKKRKGRDLAKKKAHAVAARKPTESTLLARSAAREKFGPCFVSAGWDATDSPDLVTVLVTRELPGGRYVLGSALVDRTCLGIKNGMILGPMPASEVSDIVDKVGRLHGAMIQCEPLVVQSVVFHAVDYARSLGFEPHRDFEPVLFGPRPEVLLDTPWSRPARPIYLSGPHDNVGAVLKALANAVGADGFDRSDYDVLADGEDDFTVEALHGDDSANDGEVPVDAGSGGRRPRQVGGME
jgi:hypothetical protein